MTAIGAPRIRTDAQVMFFDTDCGGVVHNIAYLRFIEIARTLLVEQLGLTLPEMAATQKYPVVVRTEIDYRRAAKLGDRLDRKSTRLNSSHVKISYAVFCLKKKKK